MYVHSNWTCIYITAVRVCTRQLRIVYVYNGKTVDFFLLTTGIKHNLCFVLKMYKVLRYKLVRKDFLEN